MKHILNIISLALLTGIVFSACRSEERFQIEGTIANAEGKVIYLEHRGLLGVVLLDSVVLRANGTFRMRALTPPNPEFYQLRIGNQPAVFAVYPDDKKLTVRADANDFAHSFTVENSPANDQLRKVDRLRDQALQQINELERQHTAQQLDDMAFIEQLDSVLSEYRREIVNLILANPASAAAYYALFQRIDDYLIFNPYSRQDYPMFGAVATSWNTHYPGTLRTQHLFDFTMRVLAVRRQEERLSQLLENTPIEVDASLPDIVLPDIFGNRVALSSLRGKVVVLDFTIYGADFSPTHNMDLNRIYTQFQARGMEIFQISFDSNEHLWRNAAYNLPWITVRDPQSVNSSLLSLYNIRDLPAVFVLDREGDVVARVTSYEELERELRRLL